MSPTGVILALDAPREPARPVFRDWPLQLVPVANRPLVAHAVTDLRSAGVDSLVLVTIAGLAAPLGAALTALAPDLPVRVVPVADGTGETAAAIAARPVAGDGPVILHTGTALLGGALEGWRERVGGERADALLLCAPAAPPPGQAAGGRRFARPGERTALGVSILTGTALDALARSGDTPLPAALREAGDLRVEEMLVTGGWTLGSDVSAVLEGNRIALGALQPRWRAASIRRSLVEGQVVIHPTALIEDSVIRGPALIGPDVLVRQAYVGPYTSIGGGSVLENAEIEHSIVLHDVRIRHVGWRLERSVIGDRAEISRQFRLPQAVHLHVGEDARISVS